MTDTLEPESPAPLHPYAVTAGTLRRDALVLGLLAADVAFGLVTWSRLPARVPTHWGLDGEPNAWGPAWMNALLMPAVGVGIYLLILLVPYLDPRSRNYALFEDTLRWVRGTCAVFFVAVHVLVTLASLGKPVNVDLAVRAGVPLLFALLGNRFGKIRPNWFVGIRLPWTLSDDEIWTKTHRLAGRLWVAAGLLLAALAFVLPPKPGSIALGAALGVVTLVPVVYSVVLWRRLAPRA